MTEASAGAGAAGAGIQAGELAPAGVLEHVRPGDVALVVNFQTGSHLVMPFTEEERRASGLLPVVRPQSLTADQLAALQRSPFVPADRRAWEEAIRSLQRRIDEIGRGGGGNLHLFVTAPYGVAAVLGKLLENQNRSRQVFIYQFFQGRWTLRVRPAALDDAAADVPFFADLETVIDNPDGVGYALCIDVRRMTDLSPMLELARRQGLRYVFRTMPLEPREGWVFGSPAQTRAALRQLSGFLDGLRRDHGGAPIHLTTSAPLSLFIELCREFPRAVHDHVIIHQFDRKHYYPVVDIGGALPRPVEPPRRTLRIFRGDEALMFQLDDEVLPAAKALSGEADGIDRLATDQETLMRQAHAFSRRVLPAQVEERIRNIPRLDIVIDLPDPYAQYAWEFLRLEQPDVLVALMPEWTLSRRVGSEGLARSRPANSRLKVLIAPVIGEAEVESVRDFLKLEALADQLKDDGAEVVLLPYGAGIEQVRQALLTFRPDVLQWIGHGKADREEAYREIVSATYAGRPRILDRLQFRNLLGAYAPPLVVLSACLLGSEPVEFGIPRDFLSRGVNAVISFRDEVAVGVIGVFSAAFYKALATGSSIHDAVQAGRIELKNNPRNFNKFVGAFGMPVLTFAHARGLDPFTPEPGDETPDLSETAPESAPVTETGKAPGQTQAQEDKMTESKQGQGTVVSGGGPLTSLSDPKDGGTAGPKLPGTGDLREVGSAGPELPVTSDPKDGGSAGPKLPVTSDPKDGGTSGPKLAETSDPKDGESAGPKLGRR